MAIKRVTLNTLTFLVNEIKERYTEKTEIGALGHLDKVAVEHLAEDLKNLINGKANAATTLAGYGITDGMTATEIAQAISTAVASADHLSRVTVSSTADINVSAPDAEKKIYMVPNEGGASGNLFSEYMVINGKLENVGDWEVDLTDYAKTVEVAASIANNAAVAGLIQLGDLSVGAAGVGNVVTELTYDSKTGKFTATKGIKALTESDLQEITQQEIKALFA